VIVRGRLLLPEAGAAWIEDGAVLVEGDEIAAVGRFADLSAVRPDAEVVGSERHVVIPGLVNAHYHGEGLSTVQRGHLDGLLEPWMTAYWARIGAIDAYLDTLWSDLKLIRSGVTTALHMAFHRGSGDPRQEAYDSLRAHRDAGLRIAFSPQAKDRNNYVYDDDGTFAASLPAGLRARLDAAVAAMPPWTTDDALTLVDDLAAETASDPRVRILASGSGPQWCSDELFVRLREAADRLGTGLHFHALESPYQREWGRRVYGRDTLVHLRDVGALGPTTSVAHAVWMTEAEIDACAETGTAICHNPSSNIRLHCGVAPVTSMLERGVEVALGVDGMGLNDDDDMLQELRVAAMVHRFPRGLEPRWGPGAVEVLRMATLGGARATTYGDAIGRLRPGAKADAVLLDWDAVAAPYLDPATPAEDALVHRARAAHVDTVIVGGEVVLAGGRFTRIDEGEVAARLADAAAATPAPPAVLDELRPAIAAWFEGWEEPDYRPLYVVNSRS
jgi:5-methylthioadenosine/S-adenosylhomocysteine deaminase